ncbi:MAG: rhomboid family intramembrane serine protease [Myxococcales bacterium]|nr:rhomboid family intramembrane serine protease [Myxococcales bacterium]
MWGPMARRAARWWSRLPGTMVLGTATLVCLLVQLASGGVSDLAVQVRLGALQPLRLAEDHELFRLFMPALLHDGVVHFVLVELALVQLAALVETVWGTQRLLVVWFWSAVAGSLVSATLSDGTSPASVGGSAAAMGLAGLLLGTTWFGPDPARGFLTEAVGGRLARAVGVTFLLGFGSWFGFPVVDNWAHLGGLAFGIAAAMTLPDDTVAPTRLGLPALVTGVLAAGLIGWTAFSGGDALSTLDVEVARVDATRLSEEPDAITSGDTVVDMLEHYERAGALEEGLEVLTRTVRRTHTPITVARTAQMLVLACEQGHPWDVHAEVAIERWLTLSPADTDALNLAAWHLVTRRDTEHRDPVRAEALVREAIARLPVVAESDRPRARAAYLDTLAEALLQEGRTSEAEEAQREAVNLGTELELDTLPDMQSRLTRIEQALGKG